MQRWDARVASRVCSSLAALLRLTETIAGAPPCTRVSFFAPPKKETKERRSPNRVGLRPIPEFGQRQAGSAELALFSDTPAAHPKSRSSDNCASFSAWHCPNSARLQGGGTSTALPHPSPPLRTGEGTAFLNGYVGDGGRVGSVATTAIVSPSSSSSASASANACAYAVDHAGKRDRPRQVDILSQIPSPETRGGLGWGSGLDLQPPFKSAEFQADKAEREARLSELRLSRCAAGVPRKRARCRRGFGKHACRRRNDTAHASAVAPSALPALRRRSSGIGRRPTRLGPRLSLVPFFGGAKKGTRVQGGAPAHLSHADAERGGKSWR
jgi:hypothetical protein